MWSDNIQSLKHALMFCVLLSLFICHYDMWILTCRFILFVTLRGTIKSFFNSPIAYLQPCGWVLKSFKCHHQDCLNNPVFFNLRFHVSSWILANISESSLLFSQYFFKPSGGNHNQKYFYPKLQICLPKIMLFQVAFTIFCAFIISSSIALCYIFLVGFLLQYVTMFQSRELVKC